MSVQVVCPNPDCGATGPVDESRLGKCVRCRRCGRKFSLVPETRAEAAPPPAPSWAFEPEVGVGGDGPSLPESFGRFRILKRLGEGGMGAVYLALDTELDRLVALKVPHLATNSGPEILGRLKREAKAAAQFAHPNFCPVHDIGQVDGVPYLRMSYIEGRTLASWIEPGRPWLPRRAALLVRRLAEALAEAHRRGVIHRDLKPGNVMLDLSGKPVIMDFGLAQRAEADDPRITATGAILGTPAYMPPEQVEGRRDAVGPRSDIYSLGVILYELLCGRRPFEGSAAKVLGMVVMARPPRPSKLNPSLDPGLEAICLKAMSKQPGHRQASMTEFARELRDWLRADALELQKASATLAISSPRLRRIRTPRSSWSPLITPVVLLSGILVGSGTWLASRDRVDGGAPVKLGPVINPSQTSPCVKTGKDDRPKTAPRKRKATARPAPGRVALPGARDESQDEDLDQEESAREIPAHPRSEPEPRVASPAGPWNSARLTTQ
jgi:serine/threonine protein kinase